MALLPPATAGPEGADQDLPYDQLVLALGSVTNRARVPGSASAFTFKTLADAVVLRNHLIERFERADVVAGAMRCPGRPEVWALGDCAAIPGGPGHSGFPKDPAAREGYRRRSAAPNRMVQFPHRKPGRRRKSRRLRVTTVAFSSSAVAAI